MRPSALTLLALLAFVGGATSDGEACSCFASGPPCQAAWSVDAVFTGRVRSIEHPPPAPIESSTDPVTVTFDVDRAFIGSEPGVLVLTTARSSASCGYQFKVGQQYLVYASRNRAGQLMASICSRTRPIGEAREDLEYLDGIGDSPAAGAQVYGRITEVRREAYEEHDVDYGPVENVMISVRGPFARDLFTGPDGRYEFGRLPTGHYTLSVAPPSGFDTRYLERTFELRDRRACHAQDFAIRAIAGATGTVMDTQGRPVAGVQVDAVSAELAGYSPPPYQHPAKTDASGRFAFDDLAPGDYVFGLNLTTRRTTAAPGPAWFFPGTTDPAAATVVVLKPGDEIELGELRMR